MRTPVHTGQFRRDVQRARKRGKDLAKLTAVVELLLGREPLPAALRDHPLTGDWVHWRDCHIEPDWLPIYRIDGDDLILARTGSHADLFR